jgi:hypothetical protein
MRKACKLDLEKQINKSFYLPRGIMHFRFLRSLTIAALTVFSTGYAQQSITGNIPTYLEACLKAVDDPYYFANFRSLPEYAPILECGFGGESAHYILNKASDEVLDKLEHFRKLEQYGNPVTNYINGVGRFSGTTLRYIVIADQITKLFNLPPNLKISEIGAGFGGQCYILSQLRSFSSYFIYDLPQVECLIDKMIKTLSVQRVHLMPLNATLPEEKIDLLISNYAFSECDRQTQLDYFERVLKKADRGYILFNQLHCFDSLSSEELIGLLDEHHMNPRIYEEPIFSYQDNLLIVWDKTNPR